MVRVEMFGRSFSYCVNGNPQNNHKPFFRGLPDSCQKGGLFGSKAQLAARAALAQFMVGQRGNKEPPVTLADGRRISAPAFKAMQQLAVGEGRYGGLSKDQRAQRRYVIADRNIQKLVAAASGAPSMMQAAGMPGGYY